VQDDTLRALASKFNLKEYIAQRFTGVRVERYGNEIAVPCPVCDDPHPAKPHLYVNVVKRMAVCYRCRDTGGHGMYNDVIQLIAALENVGYLKALLWVKDQCTVTRADLRAAIARLQKEAEDDNTFEMVPLPLPEGFQPSWDRGLPVVFERFFQKRGLTIDQRLAYDVGFTTHGYYAFRSIVPVVMDGTRWTWVGRDVTGTAEKKVLYPKGSKTGRLLFNFDVARKRDTIVLVEGVYDAIRVGPCGVALLGTSLSPVQLSRLVEAQPKTVVVMLDPDAKAKALEMAMSLTDYFPQVKVVSLDRDPDEYQRQELLVRVAKTQPIDTRRHLHARMDQVHAKLK
jgi:5S rRNA maturation endonuclease (ribonuclease M5)